MFRIQNSLRMLLYVGGKVPATRITQMSNWAQFNLESLVREYSMGISWVSWKEPKNSEALKMKCVEDFSHVFHWDHMRCKRLTFLL